MLRRNFTNFLCSLPFFGFSKKNVFEKEISNPNLKVLIRLIKDSSTKIQDDFIEVW